MSTHDALACIGCGLASAVSGRNICFACLASNTRRAMQGPPRSLEKCQSNVAPRLHLGSDPATVRPDRDDRRDTQRVEKQRKKFTTGEKKRQKGEAQLAQREASREAVRILLLKRTGGARRARGTTCILCGVHVPNGELLKHKQDVHGERQVALVKKAKRKPSSWVSVVSGGLPSLGKRR